MKNFIKVSLLIASIPLVLTSCETLEKKCYCLETSTTIEYVENMCYQASRNDVLETIYVINLPLNPEAKASEYQYDVAFASDIKNASLTLTDGLEGKVIDSVFTLGDNMLKVNIKGIATNQEATYGYIKVSNRAFTANTDRVKDAYLYAYVALSDNGSSLADKPAINEDGTFAK